MKTIVSKFVIGCIGLALASMPFPANAGDWHGHGHDNDRGGYHGDHDRGDHDRGYRGRGHRWEDDDDDNGGRYWDYHGRPVYLVNGYYGPGPGGFDAYYWNGGWYPHRRLSGGIFIYF